MGYSLTWLTSVGIIALGTAVSACGASDDGSEETNDALALWRSKEPAEYAFVYNRGCYCPLEYTAPVRVVVKDGIVLSARFADGSNGGQRGVTIDDLHREIRSWSKGEPDAFEAQYDETWGYPRTASVDQEERMADDESLIAVTCFAANARDDACPVD
ncbi:MAG TPA: DUF6174 domain-containing protein [Polyangiaceae bacterium]|nr:DUF6174 domain-containing protein [Polyangiaceae bacterium]